MQALSTVGVRCSAPGSHAVHRHRGVTTLAPPRRAARVATRCSTRRTHAASTPSLEPSQTSRKQDQRWGWWFALPLSPFPTRKTLRAEVVPKQVWTFEQLQGTLAVLVNVRMTVVALEGGGLWVHGPVAPTPECLRLLRELEMVYGEVKHIVLGTYAVEHKVFLGPFARQFKRAEVWVAPYQWSWPVDLPIGFLGLFPRKANVLAASSEGVPWADEFDYAILGPISLGLGPFVEVAFNHRRSGTLIVTDSVVEVPSVPPLICQEEPYPLLYHARSDYTQVVTDSPQERVRGWAKTVLFAFYLRPVPVDLVETLPALRNWLQSDSFPAIDGFFPFEWLDGYRASFDGVAGRLLVPPILENFVLNRGPTQVLAWADQVAAWKFKRIVPAHFATINASPREFRRAFSFLEDTKREPALARAGLLSRLLPGRRGKGLPEKDMVYLRDIDDFFIERGVSDPRGDQR